MLVVIVPAPALAENPVITAAHAHDWPGALALAAADPDATIAQKLITDARLLTPGAASAPELGDFIAANPNWPDQAGLRIRLGEAIAAEPDNVTALHECLAYKPQLDTALVRCASAARAAGQKDVATAFASSAWIEGLREQGQEDAFLQDWGSVLTPSMQWKRFDVLDWARDPAASRQVARLDPAHQALARARLAFVHQDPKALDYLPAITDEALRSDPALLLEQARWLRLTGAQAAAVALWRGALAQAEAHAPAEHKAAFWTERERLARAALASGSTGDAAFLADDAQAAPDQRTDSLFLSGWIALEKQHDAAHALAAFKALTGLSHAAITQARAWYWTGRASGQDADYARAATWPLTFYGQLAALKTEPRAALNAAIASAGDPAVTDAQARDFSGQELVRAAAVLTRWGDPHWARQFMTRQVALSQDAASFTLSARTALGMGLPDVAVLSARLAGRQGIVLGHVGWPAPYAPPAGADPALVLGIMRQESSFDSGIISPAGAVGLMQMMPATARQIAPRGNNRPVLTDAGANMNLGVAYLNMLLTEFGGVWPYAVAAYNAGPHRVRAWLAANGDPGGAGPGAPSAEMIDWIEEIPFVETRNYVERVMENAAIYAARGAK